MAKCCESPMVDHAPAPSAKSGSGEFGGPATAPFGKSPTSYGVIDPVQFSPEFGSQPKGDSGTESPMDRLGPGK